LSDIGRKIKNGVAEYESGIKTDRLINALSDTRKLISFMTDIDVRNSVSLQTLVPIDYTDEEKLELVASNKAAADKIIERVNSLEEEVVDEAIMEKVEVGIEALQALNERLTEATEQEDLDTQVAISQEMKMVAIDIEKLLQPFETEVSAVDTETESASTTATTTEEVSTTTEEVDTTTEA